MDAIAEELRALRIASGLSQDKLGRAIGCAGPFIAQIETGVRRVPPKRVGQIRQVLQAECRRRQRVIARFVA